ncbi:MAG: hypothetical protein K6C94_07880 [Candidatus Gastranaerophilales bacterium]|nr:hypothetical protein [Candidatus Gastranaerophilales bacterium]
MTKICTDCKTENPNDFIVCKNCGKILPKSREIRTGKKTNFVILTVIFLILVFIGVKVYDKKAYQVINFPDKYTNLDVLTFKLPAKWIPIGKVTYNPHSIPNMYTYFIAAINPKNNVNMQFFSTQFETDDGREFKQNGSVSKIKSEDYFRYIVKKMSPKAKNIKFIKSYPIEKKELKKAAIDKFLVEVIYKDLNPKTTKGRCWLDSFEVTPVRYLFSFEENGKTIYQLIEGRFVYFVHCYSKEMIEGGEIMSAIKFIKCENVFSYQAEEKLFKKNLNKYHVFKNNIKHNKIWEQYTGQQRRKKLAEVSFMTTNSLVGGDRFDREKFKNTIYYIEYLDDFTIKSLNKTYKKHFKKVTKYL